MKLMVLSFIFTVLCGATFAEVCTLKCSKSYRKVLAREKRLYGESIQDFKDYCKGLGGEARSGMPMHCGFTGGYEWYCTTDETFNSKVTEFGENLFEARQKARKACPKTFMVLKANECDRYIPGSGSYNSGQMTCE